MNRFNFILRDGKADLLFDGKPLLSDISISATFTRCHYAEASPSSVEESEEECKLIFANTAYFKELSLTLRKDGSNALLSLSADTATWQWMERYKFASDFSLSVTYRDMRRPDGMLAHTMEKSIYWMEAEYPEDPLSLPPDTEALLSRYGNDHLSFLPLYNDDFRTEMAGNRIVVSTGGYGFMTVKGNLLSLSVATDPYTAIRNNFVYAKSEGAITARLCDERAFPEAYDGFGWCTWDAFYKDVSEAGIIKKLEELKEKGVRLHWLLIDDGWSLFENQCLKGTGIDANKFPNGLKPLIKRIKEEYGVKHVGVWHAFTAYWEGFLEGSPLFMEWKEHLVKTAEGFWFLKPEYDAVYRFFDKWHAFLKSEGVDFIKVDNQGSYSSKIECAYPSCMANRIYHEALDASARKHFGDNYLNCMGTSTEDLMHSTEASITRSSDDYFPKREGSFAHHTQQNVGCALIQRQIRHCDFDMWWSRHESALCSSVLRAVSGGPIYVSDEVGATDPTYILPLTDGKGGIYRPDTAAFPTLDCIYLDAAKENKPLKIFNRKDDAFVVAAFSLTSDVVTGTLRLSDIPDTKGSYLAENYFTGEQTLMTKDTEIPFSVGKNEAVLFNLYPIKDGEARLGRRDKYIGIATEKTRTVKI